jgi:hypothetical protein
MRSTGFSATSMFVNNVGGVNVFEQGVANEIRTGIDPNGDMPDLYLKFEPSYLTGELWFDPNPLARSAPVPGDKTDAYSVLLHELTHAIAFNGWRDATTAAIPGSPPYESTFDQWESFDDANIYFNGPHATAIYGGPVPITYGNNWHVGNAAPRPGSDLIGDLMNGVVFFRGARYDISPLDLAIIADAGLATMPPALAGDINRDGHISIADVSSLLTALTDLHSYQTSQNLTNIELLQIADLDGDKHVTNSDIQLLLGLVAQGGIPTSAVAETVPEPSAATLLLLGNLTLLAKVGFVRAFAGRGGRW